MLSRESWTQDTVKHTMQAFLGLTVGCARRHDHVDDTISQKEYYQLRAIFEPYHVRLDRLPTEADTTKDELGFHAVQSPHYVTDIHATSLHRLGLDPRAPEVPGRRRLDIDIDIGRPIYEIIDGAIR